MAVRQVSKSGFGNSPAPEKAEGNSPASDVNAADAAPDDQPIDIVELQFDEQSGIASFQLERGAFVTLKEPKAKDFVYMVSALSADRDQGGVMGAYRLTHAMIATWEDPENLDAPKPDFDGFMDYLEDEDIARVGAAFACFPNVTKRLKKLGLA